MTEQTLEMLMDAADTGGVEARRYGRPYSGKFMYGEKTAALIVPDREDLTRLVVDVARDCPSEVATELKRLRTDSLGKDIVVY